MTLFKHKVRKHSKLPLLPFPYGLRLCVKTVQMSLHCTLRGKHDSCVLAEASKGEKTLTAPNV